MGILDDQAAEPEVVRLALEELREEPDPAYLVDIERLATRSQDPVIRYCAVDALGSFNFAGRHAAQVLASALSDVDELVRAEAADSLGRLGEVAALNPLIGALEDDSALVRASAAESIGDLMLQASASEATGSRPVGSDLVEKARAVLTQLVREDVDDPVRAYAASSLRVIGMSSAQIDELLLPTNSTVVTAELQAARYVAARSPTEAQAALDDLLELLNRALAATGSPEDLATDAPNLLNLLEDLVVRGPLRRPSNAETSAVCQAMERIAQRHTALAEQARSIANSWLAAD